LHGGGGVRVARASRGCAGEINRRLTAKEPMLLAAPALIEAYAVLTRLPPPHRLSAGDALALLEASFISPGKIVALDAASYRSLVRQAATDGIVGGRVYDAVIARCATKGKAAALLTFNAPHFLSLAIADLHVVVPGAPSLSS
jgi:predicted nucleic acid-binding protein